jgi:hypothetical protein
MCSNNAPDPIFRDLQLLSNRIVPAALFVELGGCHKDPVWVIHEVNYVGHLLARSWPYPGTSAQQLHQQLRTSNSTTQEYSN